MTYVTLVEMFWGFLRPDTVRLEQQQQQQQQQICLSLYYI